MERLVEAVTKDVQIGIVPFVAGGSGESFEIGGFLFAELGIGARHHGGGELAEFEVRTVDGDAAGEPVTGRVAGDFARREEGKAGFGIGEDGSTGQLEELPVGGCKGKRRRAGWRRCRGCGCNGLLVSRTRNNQPGKQKKIDYWKARFQIIPPMNEIAMKSLQAVLLAMSTR